MPEDFVKAMDWYRRAADKGLAAAQYGVGLMYEAGAGVPKDTEQARRWYDLAARQGDPMAVKGVVRLDTVTRASDSRLQR